MENLKLTYEQYLTAGGTLFSGNNNHINILDLVDKLRTCCECIISESMLIGGEVMFPHEIIPDEGYYMMVRALMLPNHNYYEGRSETLTMAVGWRDLLIQEMIRICETLEGAGKVMGKDRGWIADLQTAWGYKRETTQFGEGIVFSYFFGFDKDAAISIVNRIREGVFACGNSVVPVGIDASKIPNTLTELLEPIV